MHYQVVHHEYFGQHLGHNEQYHLWESAFVPFPFAADYSPIPPPPSIQELINASPTDQFIATAPIKVEEGQCAKSHFISSDGGFNPVDEVFVSAPTQPLPPPTAPPTAPPTELSMEVSMAAVLPLTFINNEKQATNVKNVKKRSTKETKLILKIKSDLGTQPLDRYKFICEKSAKSLEGVFVDLCNAKSVPLPITESGEFVLKLRRDAFNVYKKYQCPTKQHKGVERYKSERHRYMYLFTLDNLERIDIYDQTKGLLHENIRASYVRPRKYFRVNVDFLKFQDYKAFNVDNTNIEVRLWYKNLTNPITIKVVVLWVYDQ